jgi:hypothetical protein
VGAFYPNHPNRPYTVVGGRRGSWLLRGTGLHDGDSFGRYGIEVDRLSRYSPPATIVLARCRDIFGPGRSAEMTFYETARGARVFSAGVMNFGGSLEYEPQATMMENVWQRLSRS